VIAILITWAKVSAYSLFAPRSIACVNETGTYEGSTLTVLQLDDDPLTHGFGSRLRLVGDSNRQVIKSELVGTNRRSPYESANGIHAFEFSDGLGRT
jgi:hypothetical protein